MARQLALAAVIVAIISGCGETPSSDEKAIEARCQAAVDQLGVKGSVVGWMDNVVPEQLPPNAGVGTVCIVGPDARQLFVPRNGPAVSLPSTAPAP